LTTGALLDQTVCELALELMISQMKFQRIFCLVRNITTSHLKHHYDKTMLTIQDNNCQSGCTYIVAVDTADDKMSHDIFEAVHTFSFVD